MNRDVLQVLVHDTLVLFAMVNVVGNLPVFADLTERMSRRERLRSFRTAVSVAAGIVLTFALFGTWMLQQVFEVSADAFKIAGGILVFMVAARGMLYGPRRAPVPAESASGGIAVFPMGFPYLAGPGTIVTTILLMQTSGPWIASGAAVLVYIAVFPVLLLAPLLHRAIGRVGVSVVTRILYIFIAAKAVTFVFLGVRGSLVP